MFSLLCFIIDILVEDKYNRIISRKQKQLTISNSSSFSLYKTLVSNSSKPGAKAAHLCLLVVDQVKILPWEETEAIIGLLGCQTILCKGSLGPSITLISEPDVDSQI